MISRLRGTVWESKPLKLVVDVGGVGYAVAVPMADRLPSMGQAIELFVHAVYREDSAMLYGFATPAERDFFILLVEKVSGIGPKTALAILTRMPLPRLLAALSTGNVEALKSTPGVGKKTAERLILELKGHTAMAGISVAGSDAQQDAIAALVSLGYGMAEAQRTIAKIAAAAPNAPSNELIRSALKKD